jgi:hypothetical protein
LLIFGAKSPEARGNVWHDFASALHQECVGLIKDGILKSQAFVQNSRARHLRNPEGSNKKPVWCNGRSCGIDEIASAKSLCGVSQTLDHPRARFSRRQSARAIGRSLEGRIHPHDKLTQVRNKSPMDWAFWW